MTAASREWLEADGLGGFASHTTEGGRTRRYHALLLVATRPPTERRVLVNGVDAFIRFKGESLALTSQTYKPTDGETPVVRHEGQPVPSTFDGSLCPTWTYQLSETIRVEHSIIVPRGAPLVMLSWRLVASQPQDLTLVVRPFLSGRDYHSLQRENAEFDFKPAVDGPGRLRFQPYPAELPVVALFNGEFHEEAYWYRDFFYAEDRARGLDCIEDLGTPGTFTFDLRQEAFLIFGTETATRDMDGSALSLEAFVVRETEKKIRTGAASMRARAASSYIVERGHGKTILAGYPWFTDWGRDTFISMRGLCLATGRLEEARRILLEWSGTVSGGMLPNRFSEKEDAAEFNSVDSALWFVIAVHELRRAEARAGRSAKLPEEMRLNAAIAAILQAYAAGTRHGIRMDSDHLLAAGEPGVQLTWMDARIGDHVVTPRTGKPVEIQALWISALRIGGSVEWRFRDLADRAQESFRARFWNEEAQYLYDVIDVDHVAERYDGKIRPNALFAVGGLPFQILDGERAQKVVDLAESKLVTPAGLRTLSPDDPQYRGSYLGGPWLRDTAYHQGTAWPYLMGPFVEAWVRVRGGGSEVIKEAREKFLYPLIANLDPENSGHFPEIADGDAPHTPRGCPFQAWSLGEVLRLDRVVLARS